MFPPWHFPNLKTIREWVRRRKLLKNVAHVQPIVSKHFSGRGGAWGKSRNFAAISRIPLTGGQRQLHQASRLPHKHPHPHHHHHRAHHEAHQHQLVCPYIAPRATKFHAITTTHTKSLVLLQFSLLFFLCAANCLIKYLVAGSHWQVCRQGSSGFVVSLCSLMRLTRGRQVSCACFSPSESAEVFTPQEACIRI